MHSIFVTVRIKPGFADRFAEASFGDGRGSVRDEPGCFRFDILRDNSDPDVFYLYEIYENEAALETHRTTPHYKKWRATVQEMFDGATQKVTATSLFPSDDGWRKQKPHLVEW